MVTTAKQQWTDSQKWLGGVIGSLLVAFVVGAFGFIFGQMGDFEKRLSAVEKAQLTNYEKIISIKEAVDRIEKKLDRHE